MRRRLTVVLAAAIVGLGAAAVTAIVTGGGPGPSAPLALHVVPAGGGDAPGCPAAHPCTLTAALVQGHIARTMLLTAGTYHGPIIINNTVTIEGAGSSSTFFDGGAPGAPVMVVKPGVSVTVAGMTIENGTATNAGEVYGAGGVDNAGTLTLSDDVVTGNTFSDGVDGAGGIVNTGSLTLDSTNVTGNTASNSVSCAGGIANDGTLTITGTSTISYNVCNGPYVNGVGGISNGGYLLSQGHTSSVTATLNGTTVSCNSTWTGSTASTNGGNCPGWVGTYPAPTALCTAPSCVAAGGILNAGKLTATNAVIDYNDGGTFGGGLFALGNPIQLTSVTVAGNSAQTDGGGLDLGDLDGGGTGTITGSTFSDNSAVSGSGGAINVGARSTPRNFSSAQGGFLEVSNSTFAGNSANRSSGGGGALDVADHGGVAWVSVVASTFLQNRAARGNDIDNGDGGGSAYTFLAGDILVGGCSQQGEFDATEYNDAVDTSCYTTSDTTSVTDSDLDSNLSSLANNGGSTQTILPGRATSAIGLIPDRTHAVDLTTGLPGTPNLAFSTLLCPTTDQRGLTLTSGPCTVGAVQLPSTSITLASSANPSTTGQQVTYTATLTLQSFQTAPNGTVAFRDNGSPIPGCTAQTLSAGSNNTTYVATCSVTYSAAATHPITATFGADAGYIGSSTATTLSQVVNPGSSGGLGGFPTPAPTPNPPPPNPPLAPPPTQGGSSGVTPDGGGYWIITPGNGVGNFGDAGGFGSESGQTLNAPLVAVAGTPDGKGYWTVGADGGVFTHGDAGFFGSAANIHLNAPVVGIVGTPDGQGYWLVCADGGVLTFGDAGFFGSAEPLPLAAPVVGMVPTADGKGYWLIGQDGGVITFGDAGFFGSAADQTLPGPVVAMAPTPDGKGYWVVTSTGQVVPFGDAAAGSGGGIGTNPILGMFTTPTGYVLIDKTGASFPFTT